MNILFTKISEKYIKNYIKFKKNIIAIYIYIYKLGCAGYSYKLKFIKINNFIKNIFNKKILNIKNILIIIKKNQKNIILYTNISYINKGLDNKLFFLNYKSKYNCGCGKSFFY